MSGTPAGWYPDPSGDQTKIRYWDGNQWTDQFQDNPNVMISQEPAFTAAPEPTYDQGQATYPTATPDPRAQKNYQGAYQTVQPVPAKDNSSLAIVGLVLGIVGLVGGCFIPFIGWICGIVAIIMGAMSMKSLKKGMAVAGLILGILSVIGGTISSILGMFLLSLL
ncbi:MAG: DUF2510 domain-containing protein [Coriobacteriales bacterium]|nr:DUF2510 domain-containing protein [Coriobacteriales bacterium]